MLDEPRQVLEKKSVLSAPVPQTPQSLVLSCGFRVRVRNVEREATAMWKSSCHAFLRPSRWRLHSTTTASRAKDLCFFRAEWKR